jgi:hypothetical protein
VPLLTFKQLKESEIPPIVGVCPDNDTFRDYTNKVTRMLMTRGDFFGIVEKVKLCVYNSCLVWPRWAGTILAVNICGRYTEVFNHWYEFMPLSRQDFCDGGFSYHGAVCRGNVVTVNDGMSPVFNPIACGKSYYIRAYPSTQQDIGKKTRIFGVDENGQTIRTQNADLTWTDGVELTLALPFISTSFKIREVTRITKDETQGVLRYYQYDADNDVLLDLVWFEPGETSPMYRRSRLPTRCSTGSCSGVRSVEALVKLEFIPVKYDTDLVQISNLDALSAMMLSVKYSNGGDANMAKDFEAKAIRELNLELNNKLPNEQTPVEINGFGSALPIRHSIGQII